MHRRRSVWLKSLIACLLPSLLLTSSFTAEAKKPKKNPVASDASATSAPKKKKKKKPAPFVQQSSQPAEAEPTAQSPESTAQERPTKPTKPGNETPGDEASGAENSGNAKSSDEASGNAKSGDEKPGETATDESSPDGLTAYDLSVGLGGLHRNLGYTGNTDGAVLVPYALPFAWMPVVSAAWYPGAHYTGGIAGNIGVAASLEYPLGMKSRYTEAPSTEYGTSGYEVTFGARGRLPVQRHEIGAGVDFGMQSFEVGLPDPTRVNPGVPKMLYKFLRPSLSARFAVSDSIALLGSFGLRIVLDAGQVVSSQYFPPGKTSVWGLDATLGGAYRVTSSIELRLLLSLRRYQFSMTGLNLDRDNYLATGALDMYLSGAAMVAFRQ